MQTTDSRVPRYMKRNAVADLFEVGASTVDRWRDLGLIEAVETPGGTRKYRTEEIMKLAADTGMVPSEGWSAFFRRLAEAPGRQR